jgi:hypothetical protein
LRWLKGTCGEVSSALTRAIVIFWFPLAATWLMMALELPYIGAIVARMPEPAVNLAAFGVATSLAWLVESPIMMLLSASTALVHDRASYLALRRFAVLMNLLVTAGMLLLILPPVFDAVAVRLIGLPPEIASRAHAASAVLVLWPASIGYRRFYQGILVRAHLPRRVAYGTVIRLVTMSVTAALLALTTRLPGALLGAMAMAAGVLCEAVASRIMAGPALDALRQHPSSGPGPSLRQIAHFYYPLALTSILTMALMPLVTFGLGHGAAPLESLAVWPIVSAMVFLFRSGGVAYQEVGIALVSADPQHERAIRRTGLMLGSLTSGALALVAFTALQRLWFEDLSGLEPGLAAFAVWPVRILVALPALEFLLSIQRARWIVAQRTRVITTATVVEGLALAIILILAIGVLDVVGVIAGAAGMLVARIAANLYLHAYEQRVPESLVVRRGKPAA